MELDEMREARAARYRYKKYLRKKAEQRKRRNIAIVVGIGTFALILLKRKKNV